VGGKEFKPSRRVQKKTRARKKFGNRLQGDLQGGKSRSIWSKSKRIPLYKAEPKQGTDTFHPEGGVKVECSPSPGGGHIGKTTRASFGLPLFGGMGT